MLIPLADAPTALIGGKAAALQRLHRKGLPVPRSAVVPVSAFKEALAGVPLDAPDLAQRILALPLTVEGFAPRMAVRSSALGEDGRTHSHAGVYESVLGVDEAGLADAIRRCWASWASPRARAYRAENRVRSAGMAVLVQELVDARVSGVLFTVNPLTGSWREMTVEAVWGLGEPLVSGEMVPDRYLVRRPRRTPRPVQRVLARTQLGIESETPARQDEELAVVGDHVAMRPVLSPTARKLTRDDLLALCRLGLRAEALLDGPQDVEWVWSRDGQLHLLQSRPVTTVAALPRGQATLWTRRFIGERWPQGATPMGWSIVGPLLEWFIAYPETTARYLGGDPPLRVVRGHPYFNVTVFRHLAFKFPGAPPPRFMLDFFPPEEEQRWLLRAAAPPDLRVYASIFKTTFAEKRWQRFRWNPFLNPRAWDQFLAGLEPRLEALRAAAPALAIDVAEPILRDYVRVHITSLLFANLWYQGVLPLVPEGVLRAPGGTITLRVNRELRELAAHPERLGAFLAEHGHRSTASWEVFATRWSEDPEGVLTLARQMVNVPEPPTVELERAGWALRQAVELTRTYLRLREEQRYHFDRILSVLKSKLLALGATIFEDPWMIRFIERGELHLPVDELRRTAARRALELPDPDPPDFLHGDVAIGPPAADSHRIQGLGISRGRVRGRTRVLHGPEEAHLLRPGEILVARSTDPGWTPLFATAAGLILELGSELSHGAVVAREYRLPAVANIGGATHRFVDGTEVTLDGSAGVVWVH